MFAFCEFPQSFNRRKLKPCKLLIADFLQMFIILESFIFFLVKELHHREQKTQIPGLHLQRAVSAAGAGHVTPGYRKCLMLTEWVLRSVSSSLRVSMYSKLNRRSVKSTITCCFGNILRCAAAVEQNMNVFNGTLPVNKGLCTTCRCVPLIAQRSGFSCHLVDRFLLSLKFVKAHFVAVLLSLKSEEESTSVSHTIPFRKVQVGSLFCNALCCVLTRF